MMMKRIEPDWRQGTNDFDYDFRHDSEYSEENDYGGVYQGYTDFDDRSFNTTGWI